MKNKTVHVKLVDTPSMPERLFEDVEYLWNHGYHLNRLCGALMAKYVDDRKAGRINDYKPYIEQFKFEYDKKDNT